MRFIHFTTCVHNNFNARERIIEWTFSHQLNSNLFQVFLANMPFDTSLINPRSFVEMSSHIRRCSYIHAMMPLVSLRRHMCACIWSWSYLCSLYMNYFKASQTNFYTASSSISFNIRFKLTNKSIFALAFLRKKTYMLV